jgi:response regulator NasT
MPSRLEAGETEGSASAVRVLIAEDDESVRQVIYRELAELGFHVVADVSSGAEAVERSRELTPEAVLLDANLADGMGLLAAQRIAEDQPGIGVVLFSGECLLLHRKPELLSGDPTGRGRDAYPPAMLRSSLELAVVRARELREARAEADELRKQLEARKTIERAKGILMRRTGLSEQEAYRILQRTSQDRSVPMLDVAREVLASEPSFGRPPAPPRFGDRAEESRP